MQCAPGPEEASKLKTFDILTAGNAPKYIFCQSKGVIEKIFGSLRSSRASFFDFVLRPWKALDDPDTLGKNLFSGLLAKTESSVSVLLMN